MANPVQEEAPATTEKQGGKCCGCCCDYRRATIACASVVALLEVCVFFFVVTGSYLGTICSGTYSGSSSYSGYYYYYDNTGECKEHFKPMGSIEIVFSVISVLLGIGAICGAIKFNTIAVGLNAMWIFASFIAGLIIGPIYCNGWTEKGPEYTCTSIGVGGVIFGIVVLALFVYPQVMFIVEVKKGILTRETYHREKFSCCCISEGATTSAVAPVTAVTATPVPATGTVVVTESILSNGSKQIRKEETNPDGSKTVTIIDESPEENV